MNEKRAKAKADKTAAKARADMNDPKALAKHAKAVDTLNKVFEKKFKN